MFLTDIVTKGIKDYSNIRIADNLKGLLKRFLEYKPPVVFSVGTTPEEYRRNGYSYSTNPQLTGVTLLVRGFLDFAIELKGVGLEEGKLYSNSEIGGLTYFSKFKDRYTENEWVNKIISYSCLSNIGSFTGDEIIIGGGLAFELIAPSFLFMNLSREHLKNLHGKRIELIECWISVLECLKANGSSLRDFHQTPWRGFERLYETEFYKA